MIVGFVPLHSEGVSRVSLGQFVLRAGLYPVLIQAFPAGAASRLSGPGTRLLLKSHRGTQSLVSNFTITSNHSSQGASIQILAPFILGIVHPSFAWPGAAPMSFSFWPVIGVNSRVNVVFDRVKDGLAAHTGNEIMPGLRSCCREFMRQLDGADEVRITIRRSDLRSFFVTWPEQ